MYDPLCGRFCSRDPLRYRDTNNLYQSTFVGSKTDPQGLLTITPWSPKAACGSGGVNWRLDAGRNELVIVQRICGVWNFVDCRRQGDCCNGAIRNTCKKCFYELLLPHDQNPVNLHDLWSFSWTSLLANCGTRGTVKFTSEIRAFPTVAEPDIAYRHNWKPAGTIKVCGLVNLTLNRHSDEDNPPAFWNNQTSSKQSYMRTRWKCCAGDGKQFITRYGTIGRTQEEFP
jgi:hypothetical protein